MSTLLDRLNLGTTVDVELTYDTVDSAFIKANSAYTSQNTTGVYANTAYIHANSAYLLANTIAANTTPTLAYLTANSAYIQANTGTQYANSAGSYANSAYIHANSAYRHTNSSYNQANTATTNAATADQRAVTSGSYANSAYTQANTATTNAATADQRAVTSGSYANSAFTKANNSIQSVSGTSGIIFANTSGTSVTINLTRTAVSAGSYGTPTTYPVVTVDEYGRVTGITTQTVTTSTNQATFGVTYAYDKFNGDGTTLNFNLSRSISAANTMHVFVNGIAQEYSTVWSASGALLSFTSGSAPPVGTNNVVVEYLIQPGAVALIDTVTDTSNTTVGRAATPLAVNTVYTAVQSSGNFANSAYIHANSAYNQANTATTNAATADQRAVTSGVYANAAFIVANAAFSVANAAFSVANTKFATAGGTMTGSLLVQGSITATGDISAFDTSDIRLKTNIEKIENALDKIDSLNGVFYNWNEEALEKYPEKTTKKEVGLIAQELNDVLPEVVSLREDGYYGVKYDRIIGLLIEGIKELREEIKDLRNNNGIN